MFWRSANCCDGRLQLLFSSKLRLAWFSNHVTAPITFRPCNKSNSCTSNGISNKNDYFAISGLNRCKEPSCVFSLITFYKYWKNCSCSTFKLFALKNTFAERCMDLVVFVQNTFMHSSHHILWISTLRDFRFAILQHIKVHFKWASNRYWFVSYHHHSQ